MTHAVLLSHGSADPRYAEAVTALEDAVAALLPGTTLHSAVLDHGPSLADACQRARDLGAHRVVVAPLFLTPAFHASVDVPAAVDEARRRTGLTVEVTEPLGTRQELLDVLGADLPPGPVILAVAGTSDLGAQAALEEAAGHWAARRGADVAVGHSALGTPTIADALAAHPTASVARYVLFPGALTDRIARAAEGRAIAGPLYAHRETAQRIAELLAAGA